MDEHGLKHRSDKSSAQVNSLLKCKSLATERLEAGKLYAEISRIYYLKMSNSHNYHIIVNNKKVKVTTLEH